MGILDGKRIVVTGSTRGLGRGFVEAVAAAGAAVVVNGTTTKLVDEVVAGIIGRGGAAVGVAGSVADDAVAEQLVRTCVDEHGGIDAAVNLRGTWSVSRHAARAMQDTGGLLLQVISGSAMVGSIGQTNYAASKAGVLGMMYSWDVELRRYAIRVNALWPVAQTEMTQVVFEGAARRAEQAGRPAPAPAELGFGTPDTVAPVVVHLCSDRAAHLRSQIVTFNGSKLGLWTHPHETILDRRPSWTLDELADALDHADEHVHVAQM